MKIGDRVRFMDVTGGGVITRIEGRLAFVEDEDGFEIPVLLSELVLVEKTEISKNANEAGIVTEKELSGDTEISEDEDYDFEEDGTDDDPKFVLAFLSGEKPGVQSGSIRLYLINDSNYFSFFTVNETGSNGQAVNIVNDRIEPNTKLSLGKYLVTELDGKTWEIGAVMFKKGKPFKPLPVIQENINLKGAKLMKESSFVDNDYFDEKAMLYYLLKGSFEQKLESLSEKEIEEVKKEKGKKEFRKKAKRRDEPGILEVDLHIHELLDDTGGLSNSEMLAIQMDKFHQVMKENLKNKKRKIVFIHGIGNGTLKTELRKALDRKYKDHYYQDASFREYGYGATMVII